MKRKQEEYVRATGETEQDTNFVRIMPIFWHITDSEDRSREVEAKVRRRRQGYGFTPQEDKVILKLLWPAALPFGLITKEKATDYIDRDFICQPEMAAMYSPIQADFAGGGESVNLFAGRKGQVIGSDLLTL